MGKLKKIMSGRGKILSEQKSLSSKVRKEQLLCIAAALLLAAFSTISNDQNIFKDKENTIERGAPGDADKSYELSVGGISASDENFSIKVSSREYTADEAAERFESLMEEIAVHIVGKNQGLDRIVTDMVLPKRVEGYGGITLSWSSENKELIDSDGTVNNIGLDKPENVILYVRLRSGKYSEEFALPVTIFPAEADNVEKLKAKLQDMIRAADENGITEDMLVLPDSIDGHEISYKSKKNRGWVNIIAAGIVASVLIGLRPEQEKRRKEKERETELLLGYSEVVSKLMVYMGAGLAVRNAWIIIAEIYNDELKAGKTEKKAVYDEMLRTAVELKNGVPETKAYAGFAKRCPQKCYIKLMSLLEQDMKTGDSKIRAEMELEVRDAFEQRKNTAKRLGEEAGTKLMLPLMLSLLTVLIITVVPAMLTLI